MKNGSAEKKEIIKKESYIGIKAYAKINLGLKIVGLRDDGYHFIDTIMQTISLYDTIYLRKSRSICKNPKAYSSVESRNSFNGTNERCSNIRLDIIYADYFKDDEKNIPTDERNTCIKAAALMQKEFSIREGLDIFIKKNIPSGAGLAGGSSDAAAVIILINKLFNLKLSDDKLMKIGAKVGADVPFFIKSGTCICTGIGENVIPIKPFCRDFILIIKPDIMISTKDAYKRLDEKFDFKSDTKVKSDAKVKSDTKIKSDTKVRTDTKVKSDIRIKNGIDINDKKSLENIFESVIFPEHEEIYYIKSKLMEFGANASYMTGSGSSIYAIFEDEIAALKAKKYFKENELLKKIYNNSLKIFLCKTIN